MNDKERVEFMVEFLIKLYWFKTYYNPHSMLTTGGIVETNALLSVIKYMNPDKYQTDLMDKLAEMLDVGDIDSVIKTAFDQELIEEIMNDFMIYCNITAGTNKEDLN
jgi:hypothetical protein